MIFEQFLPDSGPGRADYFSSGVESFFPDPVDPNQLLVGVSIGHTSTKPPFVRRPTTGQHRMQQGAGAGRAEVQFGDLSNLSQLKDGRPGQPQQPQYGLQNYPQLFHPSSRSNLGTSFYIDPHRLQQFIVSMLHGVFPRCDW